MDILLFGIQGSGKGTQAKALSLALNFPIFEAGAELRKMAVQDTPTGNEIRKIISKGNLVPPGLLLLKVMDFLEHPASHSGIIFDGIPRAMEQAESFDEVMKTKHRDNLAIAIDLSENAAIERLLKRRICTTCGTAFMPDYSNDMCNHCGGILIHRADDTTEAIQTRFGKYKAETLPVIEHYQKQGKLIVVDGNQAIIDVTKDIFNQLSPQMKLRKQQNL